MAWFDRTDAKVPDELRDARPEDLVDAVKFFKANKDKLPAVETELATTKQTLESVSSEFKTVKEKLAILEANPPATKTEKPAPDASKPTEWYEDPDKALFERMKPLADFSIQQGAMIAQMKLEQFIAHKPGKYGDDTKLYSKYQKEIEEMMGRETPVNQSNPQAWYNAFVFVKGLHGDEIQDARVSGNKEFFGEPGNKSAPGEPNKSDVVTEADKKMASKFGSFLKPEDLVAARKGFTYVDDTPKESR